MVDHEIATLLPEVWEACRSEAAWDPEQGRKPTSQQVALLGLLDPAEPSTVGDLARRVGVRPAAASQMLDRMERHGWLARSRASFDARVVEVRLTEAGAALKEAASPMDLRRLGAMLATLTHIEQGEVLRGLRLLARAAGRVA